MFSMLFFIKRIWLFLIGLFCFSFGFASISVSPLKFELNMDPGQSVQETIRITNSWQETVTLYSSKQDFIAWDDTWTPRFIDNEESLGFGLVDWIQMEQEKVTIPPNTKQEVTFTLQLPENAEPGGHYWAVFYWPGAWQWQVGVQARLGVLILVQVEGEVVQKWVLTNFQVWKKIDSGIEQNDIFEWDDEVSFYLNFENQWNVHLQPEWQIDIYDNEWNKLTDIGSKDLISSDWAYIWETVVDYLPVNEAKGNVLPQSDRSFYTSWEGFGYQTKNKVEFEDFQTYYNNQQRSKKLRQTAFYETIKQVPVQETFTAKLNLSYEKKNGNMETFEREKEFDIKYDSIRIVKNWPMLWGFGLLIVLIFGWVGYYFIIGRKKLEAKLKAQLQKQISQEQQDNDNSQS